VWIAGVAAGIAVHRHWIARREVGHQAPHTAPARRAFGALLVVCGAAALLAPVALAMRPTDDVGPVVAAPDEPPSVATLRDHGLPMIPLETVDGAAFVFRSDRDSTFGNRVGRVEIFEFGDEETARAEAKIVSPDGSFFTRTNADGSGIGTAVDWVASPHFYLSGRTIVFYLGDSTPTLAILADLFGPQFAGR
jgi:hypothetical protein